MRCEIKWNAACAVYDILVNGEWYREETSYAKAEEIVADMKRGEKDVKANKFRG